MPALKSMNTASAIAITTSVLVVWWTTTLSMITCVPSGVARPISWMKSEASSTSRHTLLCRSNSFANHLNPNPAARAASGSVGDWLADSFLSRRTFG